MVENKKNGEARPGGNTAAIILFAAVAVLLAAGVYYIWQGSQHPTPPENQNASQMDTPMAKLLLSAYEKGGKLDVYYLKYMRNYLINDSGVERYYEVGSNGSDQWVSQSEDFGVFEGYFGTDPLKEVVCLTYGGAKKCTIVKNGTVAMNIANDLKTHLPNRKVYEDMEKIIRKHIEFGAITFLGDSINESVGVFETKKITYSLSYKNMTVDRLLGLGVPPNSPEVVSKTNQVVNVWIDNESGLMVKTLATYHMGGVVYSDERTFLEVSTAPPVMLENNGGVVSSEVFMRFYQESVEKYETKLECLSKLDGEKNLCLKTYGVEIGEWEICWLIDDDVVREQCALIVAQTTNTPQLCGKLALYPDDCYIAIAGETGNFELCGNLKNTSLLSDCNDAAAKGARKKEDEAERMRRLEESRNCGTDSDCGLLGSAGQYCLPKNSTLALADEVSPLHSCLAGIPCGCNEGFCGFRKNDSYYACISEVETSLTEAYIQEIIAQANSTNSSG